MRWFITLLVIVLQNLCANENVYDVDFHSLDPHYIKTLKGKTVKIRGFLYSNANNEWILSPEPHLKTCCIGSKEKAAQQIFLEGSFDQKWINHAMEFEGLLIYDGRQYFLKEPVIVQNDKSHTGIILAGLGMVLFVGWLIKYRVR